MKNTFIKNDEYTIMLVNRKDKTYQVLIDNDDVERVSKIKWHIVNIRNDERYLYAVGQLNKKRIRLHRFITNCPEEKVIDHINHNTLDNRKSNLKVCSGKENLSNGIWINNKRNKSGIVGVSPHYLNGKTFWRASFKQLDLGYFKEIKHAIKARKIAEKVYLMAVNTIGQTV